MTWTPVRPAATAVRVLLLLCTALAWPTALRAQDARLGARLDGATASAVAAVVDSARNAGLPTEPLVQKALEGASKGADGARIAAAVRRLAQRLGAARSALGAGAREDELVAGAAALELGAGTTTLARLRAQQPDRPIAAALVGLSFLLQRGVPAQGSLDIVRSMLEARLSDADFSALQRLIDQDVRAGATAADAASTRARALIQHPRLRGGGVR
jgi:hypothetical protein